MFRNALLLSSLSLVLAGCAEAPNAQRKQSADPATSSAANATFEDQLLAIARDYPQVGRVDGADPRWSPQYCEAPRVLNEGQLRMSASKDSSTHGQKLYYLYARDRAAYLSPSAQGSPVGQYVVKQAWAPKEVELTRLTDAETRQKQLISCSIHLAPPDETFQVAWKDGKMYRADHITSLFIMLKLDPQTPGTDEGWVYGTVSADGKTVTAAGRIASCMECHRTQPDRLFGLSAGLTKGEKK
jgi:hypothetical protein